MSVERSKESISTSMEAEERDDSSTIVANEPDARTLELDLRLENAHGSHSDTEDNRIEENEDMMENARERNNPDSMDSTELMENDEDKLDMVSVLSGTIEGDNDKSDQLQSGFYGKNLSKAFDSAEEMDRTLNGQSATPNAVASAASGNCSETNGIGGTSQTRGIEPERNGIRPPLAPGRNVNKSNVAEDVSSKDDKRLKVYLRVRPPVCASGKQGSEGSENTIEVINGKSPGSLPSTVRTYPPIHSNAAKVIRCGSKHTTSDPSLKKALSSKSLVANDDGSSDSGTECAEVRGVKEYCYSGVFGPNSTQKEVYDNIAAQMVEGLFPQMEGSDALGESALLFTLGVTNAGKTHTVMGTGFEKRKGNAKKNIPTANMIPQPDWGIIPRSLHHMLTRIDSLNKLNGTEPRLQLFMSYLEIYNEQIYDLLPDKNAKAAPRYPGEGPPSLKLRESRRGRIFVRGLARHPVENVQQGLELAQEAKKNRHTASNNINSSSSRSHSICQLEVVHMQGQGECKTVRPDDSECETDDESVCSKRSSGSRGNMRRKPTIIWICDLAGSERSKRTGIMSHTRHQKEAALINASLMNLMRCLREMLNHQPKKRGAASRGGVVPFRDSKITHLFMNHLTGPSASKTCMIVNVNPASDDYDETQHVLSYASTARSVKISAVDYNRKRRFLAQESVQTDAPESKKARTSPVKRIANIMKKLSPNKKRKVIDESKPIAKRLRSTDTNTCNGNGRGVRSGASKAALPKPRPTKATKSFRSQNNELEQLREENFSLKITVDDLRKQLEECEADIRNEVVDTMNEQIQETKEWYEKYIADLKQKMNALQSSNAKQDLIEAQKYSNDLLERVNECEEEMQRMRTDHEAELEDSAIAHLQIVKQHEEEIDKLRKEHKKELGLKNEEKLQLEQENGSLRHKVEELRVSHDALLAEHNNAISLQDQKGECIEETSIEPKCDSEKENLNANQSDGDELKSSILKKLPRERVSEVASIATNAVEIIVSPKSKRGGWFMKSPKVGAGGDCSTKKSNRSPLEKIDTN